MIFISDDENKDSDQPYVTYALVGLLVCGTVFSGIMFQDPVGQHKIEAFTLQQALGPSFGSLLLAAKLKALGAGLASFQSLKLFSGVFVQPNFFSMLWFAMLLWVFGDNVEYAMGSLRYAVFFFLCALLTSLLDIVVTHTGPGIKLAFGPGGAVSAVAGAYAAYFPKARLKIEMHFGGRRNRSVVFGSSYGRSRSTTSYVTALGFIGFYFVLNLICAPLLAGAPLGPIPYTSFPFWGQVAGFALGYGLAFVFRDYNVVFTLDEEKQEYIRPVRKNRAYDPFAPETPPETPAEPAKKDDSGMPPSF